MTKTETAASRLRQAARSVRPRPGPAFPARLVGVRASDDGFRFLVSGVIGRFRSVGTLTLGAQTSDTVRFDARNSGGGIRPLPPVNFYRG
ncbi:hypothetical protein [Mycobacterium deserti]|uniref:Uncharacterized protein n=1 Tax=Mycobacterium deserti TaxID=2978347 RepID=A0ABT2M8A3_9MYCO|nr:hypothetical protein [Mycobacterium deserti]MCT7658489.1 hypothetical protein [Mycobacterium deserti]